MALCSLKVALTKIMLILPTKDKPFFFFFEKDKPDVTVYILLCLFIEMTEKLLFMLDSVLISEIFHRRWLQISMRNKTMTFA